MAAAMDVILLERIESLGAMGDVVRVKPGYARNYLLPQKKALRASKDNKAYFESQRAALEKLNAEKKKEAQSEIKKFEGVTIILIRHAADGGQLYGSVTARDVAEAIADQAKLEVGRNQVQLNQGFKTVGLFPVSIALHPEVKAEIIVNVARSEEEAKQQAKTGKAVVGEDQSTAAVPGASEQPDLNEEAMRAFLDEETFEATQRAQAEEVSDEAALQVDRSEKSAKRGGKKKSRAHSEDEDEDDEA